MKPECSVIVPSYGRENVVGQTLGCLAEIARGKRIELLLVDQTGYAGVAFTELAKEPFFRHLHLGRPNLPAARNKGAAAALGEILVFLDDDALPQPSWLENHLRHYGDPRVAAVAGRVIDSNAPGEREKPVEFDAASGAYVTDFGCRLSQETISVPGCNFSVRKKIWETIRFDPSFTANAYFEEVDFAFRLRRAGGVILFEANAAVRHDLVRSGGCRYTGPKEIYHRFRNYGLFHFRHGDLTHLPSFLRKEKNFLEFVSRRKQGGHSLRPVLAAARGLAAGGLRGLGKRAKDLWLL